LALRERWCGYLEEQERFWRFCLQVARSKPQLCAEEVEAEAVDIMIGLVPGPGKAICYDSCKCLSMVLGESAVQIIYNYLESRYDMEMTDARSKREELRIILRRIMGEAIASILEEKLISI